MSTSGNITLNIDGLVTDINGIRGKVAALESRRYIVEESHDGTEWYKVWSDGWIEQGGYKNSGQNNGTVTFLKPFSDINYSPYFTPYGTTDTDTYTVGLIATAKTKTTCTFATANWEKPFHWYACGY